MPSSEQGRTPFDLARDVAFSIHNPEDWGHNPLGLQALFWYESVQTKILEFAEKSYLAAEKLTFEKTGHDHLTGLPNRHLFKQKIETLFENEARLSPKNEKESFIIGQVLFVDVNGLKGINDTFGHPEGDILLQKVSTQLHSTLRGSDVLGRLGGDEFVAYCSSRDGVAAEAIVERMKNMMSVVPVSIGMVPLTAQQAESFCCHEDQEAFYTDFTKLPDKLMYQAKELSHRFNKSVICFTHNSNIDFSREDWRKEIQFISVDLEKQIQHE